MKPAIYAFYFLLATSQAARALSYGTPESSFAGQVAMFARIFAAEHGGQSPASWSDFQPYLDRPIDEAYRDITPSKRYAFLSQPLHLPRPYEGDLLIITRRPFRDGELHTNWYGGISHGLREPGRYIIYRTPAGDFHSSYVEESYVQNAFRGSESLLPSPDTEPLRRRESEARFRTITMWTVIALIAAVFLARRLFPSLSISSANDRNA